MKSITFAILLLLTGSVSGAAGGNSEFNQLVMETCRGFKNCEMEGKIGYLQGKAINRIVYEMCKVQLSAFERFACYDNAYERIIYLPTDDLIRSYKGRFSTQLIKSYYHYLRRTCRDFYCGEHATDCDESIVYCWQKLSLNMVKNIETILEIANLASHS